MPKKAISAIHLTGLWDVNRYKKIFKRIGNIFFLTKMCQISVFVPIYLRLCFFSAVVLVK